MFGAAGGGVLLVVLIIVAIRRQRKRIGVEDVGAPADDALSNANPMAMSQRSHSARVSITDEEIFGFGTCSPAMLPGHPVARRDRLLRVGYDLMDDNMSLNSQTSDTQSIAGPGLGQSLDGLGAFPHLMLVGRSATLATPGMASPATAMAGISLALQLHHTNSETSLGASSHSLALSDHDHDVLEHCACSAAIATPVCMSDN
jgi:hypothetical protein